MVRIQTENAKGQKIINNNKRRLKMSEQARDMLIGLGVGMVVGAAAGMLLSPKSGKENREFVRGKYREYMQRVKEKMNKGKSSEMAEAEAAEEMAFHD
jgi:gas vesicle protein